MDALLEATARVLVTDGYDRASTNRIAAAAGVGIGSLYQYFPSKEALVAGVVERHTQALLRVGRDALLKAAARPIEDGVRALVRAGIDAHRVDPKLHRVLAEETPHTGRNMDLVQETGRAALTSYLDAHRAEIDVADVDLAAFMVVTTIEALTHAAVLWSPEMLAGDKADAFADEVALLVLRYLKPASARLA